MYKTINSRRRSLNISFRSWDMYYYPSLPESNTILWNDKLARGRERPGILLIALRNNSNQFIHCDLSDVRVHLNSDSYPYDNLNLKFDKNRFAHMYSRFKESYYTRPSQPLLKRDSFKTIALIITLEYETIKTGPIDIRIALKPQQNIPLTTSVYCLILHDRLFENVT